MFGQVGNRLAMKAPINCPHIKYQIKNKGAASLASLQATSLRLLPLLLLAGVLDSKRWMTEMIRLVHNWGWTIQFIIALRERWTRGIRREAKALM
jgi:hypothetical protein